MTVFARSVNNAPQSDITASGASRTGPSTDHSYLADMRAGGRAAAGSFVYRGDRVVTGWHRHELHQLEYGVHGVLEVETEAAHYLLPPQQAAWIPALVVHETTINAAVETVSVFFAPGLVPAAGDRARILPVPPLIREMMLHARRWPIGGAGLDGTADLFFRTLGLLVSELLDHEAPLSLPRTSDPVLAAAAAYTRDHLATVTAAEVSRAVGVSERTLRRQLAASFGMTWRSYVLRARLLRAMALLAEPGDSIMRIAAMVGFDSAGAFTRAFTRLSGETPSSYRRRISGRTNNA